MFTIACCLVVGLGLDLVSGWLVVMNTYLCYTGLSLSHCRTNRAERQKSALTDRDFGPGDFERAKTKAPVVRRRLDSEEHDVADDVAENKHQTTDEALRAREVAATRSTTHREPDMLVVDSTDVATT